MELAGKVALVTGGARRLGKAIALGLAQEGMHIVVHYGGSADAAEETVGEISALGVEAVSAQADMGQPEDIARLFDVLRERFGRLDVLVNSAANFQKKDFLEVTLDDWHAVMSVNLRAPFLCSQHAARLMREGDGGVIINITDLMGITPRRTFPIHSISKASLISLTEVMAISLGPDIRVNAIAPGAILPPATVGESDTWDRMGETLPVKHTGDPVNVQQAVAILAKNDFMTGHVLVVDGGESLLGPFAY
jgi:NAD(P)-dependent dehydrogenase (short-subunit alcohol dehydrogenase family)